jgi:tRNA(Ile)-lysidine synthase
MAGSPIPRPTANRTSVEVNAEPAPAANPCDQALAQWCYRWLPDETAYPVGRVAVAFSAGADSTALLLAAHQRWPGRMTALHVNHGLQAAAPAFEQQARQFCAKHGIALQATRVQAAHSTGQSPENVARTARYVGLAQMAAQAGATCVLLGQHADDQAETLLLALSRGAGLPGMASMPEQFMRHGMVFGRPLLALPSRDIRTWLVQAGHAFVDDPSNADLRFTRNRIRSTLIPAWEDCFPGFRPMLARSTRHAAQAQLLLDELAQLDLAQTGIPPSITELQALSRARQTNALRHWLRKHEGVAASAAQLDELLDQIQDCRTRGHQLRLKVASGFVIRCGERLNYASSI